MRVGVPIGPVVGQLTRRLLRVRVRIRVRVSDPNPNPNLGASSGSTSSAAIGHAYEVAEAAAAGRPKKRCQRVPAAYSAWGSSLSQPWSLSRR